MTRIRATKKLRREKKIKTRAPGSESLIGSRKYSGDEKEREGQRGSGGLQNSSTGKRKKRFSPPEGRLVSIKSWIRADKLLLPLHQEIEGRVKKKKKNRSHGGEKKGFGRKRGKRSRTVIFGVRPLQASEGGGGKAESCPHICCMSAGKGEHKNQGERRGSRDT